MTTDRFNTLVHNDALDTLVLCSFRYALGRQTYMPSLVQDIARGYVRGVTTATLRSMAREIEQERNLGSDYDAKDWREFARWCTDEIARREAASDGDAS